MRARGIAIGSLVLWIGLATVAIVVLRVSVVEPDGQPVSLAFEVLRRSALGAAWYVLALTLAGAAARGLRARAIVRVLDALTVEPLRRTIRGAVGVSLAGALALSGPAIAAAGPDDPPVVTLHRLPPTASSTTLPFAPPRTWAPIPESPPAKATEWHVRPGECFWTIAESVLASRLGRAVPDREIVPYWLQLIAANRARLRDRDNPDLIFPGQTFVLPR